MAAQTEDLADVDRRIGARSFARLLGEWRPRDGRGLATALADRVRLLVLDGRLPLQTRVPAERELASVLDVSRTTVAAAYDELAQRHADRPSGLSLVRIDLCGSISTSEPPVYSLM